jgi:hypothetical protein
MLIGVAIGFAVASARAGRPTTLAVALRPKTPVEAFAFLLGMLGDEHDGRHHLDPFGIPGADLGSDDRGRSPWPTGEAVVALARR